MSSSPRLKQPETPADSRERIEKDGLVWLLVGAIGFVVGLSVLTGPLAWVYGSRLRQRARQLGIDVPGRVQAAWIVGIVTTVLTAVLVVATVVVVVMLGLAAISLISDLPSLFSAMTRAL